MAQKRVKTMVFQKRSGLWYRRTGKLVHHMEQMYTQWAFHMLTQAPPTSVLEMHLPSGPWHL